MPCKHPGIRFQIVIERWIDGEINGDVAAISRDDVSSLKVLAVCPDCRHEKRYNAYSVVWHAKNTYGAQAGERWPTWLLNRMRTIRQMNADVTEACIACGVIREGDLL